LEKQLLQSLWFGLWHLLWVVKSYQLGNIQSTAEIGFAAPAKFLPQLSMGLIWGYLFFKMGNLCLACARSTMTNSTLNFVHVSTVEGLDTSLLGMRKISGKEEATVGSEEPSIP